MGRPRKSETVAMITWLGEDNLHTSGYGPQTNTWGDLVFQKGVPLMVEDQNKVDLAKGNPFYEVTYSKAPEEKPEADAAEADDVENSR